MEKSSRDWVGKLYELACPNCKKKLTVALIAEEVIDEDTGEPKTKFVDEECECGSRIELFMDSASDEPKSS